MCVRTRSFIYLTAYVAPSYKITSIIDLLVMIWNNFIVF